MTEEEKVKETPSMLDESKRVLAEMKEQNIIAKAENDRKEQLLSETILSGKSEAGSVPPKEKTEEQKSIDGAKALLAGTGFENQIFPDQ